MKKKDIIILKYLHELDSKIDIVSISRFFPQVEFIYYKDVSEIIYEINSYTILVLDIDGFIVIKENLDKVLDKKFLVVLYDPYEKFFQEYSIPDYVFDILTEPVFQKKLHFVINKAFLALKYRIELDKKYHFKSKELQTLNAIGISLSNERDIDKLLENILSKSLEITGSDSGSLYIVIDKLDAIEDPNNYFANKELLFKLAENYTLPVNFKERPLELSKKSIAGYVALTGKPLLIHDAYHLPPDSEFRHNKTFDESIGYRCKSMLIVPMKNQKDELIGVIQLINKKIDANVKLTSLEIVEKQVIEYSQDDRDLVYSLASQAAILIDNTNLYNSIKELFEGFIKASVKAIEARDPTTSGHSERVAALTVSLAEKVDNINSGHLRSIKFSKNDIQEIKYASLLHDFGKIGVRENVLTKAKKLYPYELDIIQQRFKYIRKCMELNLTKAKLNYIIDNTREKALSYFPHIDKIYEEKFKEIDDTLKIILNSNEPAILPQEVSAKLHEIGIILFEDSDKTQIPYLSPCEIKSLSVVKGSLSEDERKEIESHVIHTYEFLKKIPWTNEFKKVPFIAYAHHEKLDGSGYPRQIDSKNIPIQSKMMTISDIYDALTASDRPYKKALPVSKALDIISYDVKGKKIDEELFKIFIEAKIYEKININKI
ncbi:MAG: GAF domain-containing protein [Desulfobacterales bacterium]|nr:GAF domain-containing protein [Desulfobacterales bacterium]